MVRDVARELAKWLGNANSTQKKGSGNVRIFVSRDWEIAEQKRREEQEKENKLPHPLEAGKL